MTGQFSDQFRLSITKALGDQLTAAMKTLEPAPLTQANLDALETQATARKVQGRSGVYQLFRNGNLIYVGKADVPLVSRLGDHLRKLSCRTGISIDEMSFRCLYVEEDLSAVAPEKLLIKWLIKQHEVTGHMPWNNNGFGNNDPGRNRDKTVIKENHFDLAFRIDLTRKVQGLTPGEQPLSKLLAQVKKGVPFNFRYKRAARFNKITTTVPEGELTADEAFRLIAKDLPAKWQICALLGYAIMYDDAHSEYPSAWRYYRGNEVVTATPKTKPAGKHDEDEADEDDDEDA